MRYGKSWTASLVAGLMLAACGGSDGDGNGEPQEDTAGEVDATHDSTPDDTSDATQDAMDPGPMDQGGDPGTDEAPDPGTDGDDDTAADATPDAEPDAQAETTSDASGDGAGSDEVALNNVQGECGTESVLRPADEQEGFVAAVRLTPPEWPFAITDVLPTLLEGTSDDYFCVTDLGATVSIFADSSETPPATPVAAWERSIPEAGLDAWDSTVDPPLVLQQGEHVFVMVALAASFPDTTCIVSCPDPPSEANRNFWGGAAAPPFDWKDLKSFGFDHNLNIAVLGEPSE